ncbi:MAG TPA: DNA methyltransferase [Sumerlaeia bacterium]|nr:DNA methyltransferase [Sumerlaeia bacterium]
MLTNEWQQKSKQWGHPLHAMCSYMGMFPPRLPHYFIQKFTRRDDAVLDPFCGRGTTPFQACVEGRVGIGVDPNPLAYALTRAKVDPPDPADLRNRVDDLSNDMFFAEVDREPDAIRMLFHEHTLSQLVFLKQALDPADRIDAFLIAVLLGMLHGGALGAAGSRRRGPRKGSSPYLSIPMPNTFSMSPGYIRRYADEKGLEAPKVDVFPALRARVDRLLRLGLPQTRGRAWAAPIQELRNIPDPALKRKKVRLIVTSPPYLKVLKYGLYNWIRLWFLDESPGDLDERLDQHRKLEPYLAFMLDTCRLLYRVTAPGGVCALVIGDVRKGGQEPIVLAEEVWRHIKRKRTLWQRAQIIEDALPRNSKVSKIWGEEKKGRATLTDRVLVLYKESYAELQERVAW